MKLKYCTFTGADDAVDAARLASLSEHYPFVEWAIRYSPGDQGNPRDPTDAWIDAFLETCAPTHKSIHLCKDALTRFAAGDVGVVRRIVKFQRVQLNLGFQFDATTIHREGLAEQVRAHSRHEFILQYSDRTKEFLPLFNGIPNVAVLFDASAGTGQSPEKWPAPISGRFCGYAGGFGPHNIGENIYHLLATVPQKRSIWIDMESRVRTPSDQFDIEDGVVPVLKKVRDSHSKHWRNRTFIVSALEGPTS